MSNSPRPTYKGLEGQIYPSVTTCMKDFKSPRPLMIWANRIGLAGTPLDQHKAAAIGSIVHDAIRDFVRGDDPEARFTEAFETEEVNEEELAMARHMFEEFERWLAKSGLVIVAVEVQLCSDRYQFGGTIDAIVRDAEGRYGILDWKSSKRVYEDHVIQLAAYRHLLAVGRPNRVGTAAPGNGEHIEFALIVRLGKGKAGTKAGTAEGHYFDENLMEPAWLLFRNLRRAYEYRAILVDHLTPAWAKRKRGGGTPRKGAVRK